VSVRDAQCERISDGPVAHEALRPEERRVMSMVEPRLEGARRTFGGGDDRLRFLRISAQRLLAENVFAGFERSHGYGSEIAIDRCDDYDIDIGARNHIAPLRMNLSTDLGCDRFGTRLVEIRHGDDDVARARRGRCAASPDQAASDDGDVHSFST
jgi:hypothetical protein